MEEIKEKNSSEVKLPNSKKIYIESNGSTVNAGSHSLKVPFREISLSPSKEMDGTLSENPPVRVYDTSGPWTDPGVRCDVRDGLPQLRREWIIARGDVEEEANPLIKTKFNGITPLRAKPGRNVSQMHYARKGIVTPEMEYVAIRENLGRQIAFEAMQNGLENDRSSLYHQHNGDSFEHQSS
jgi:phosphomethylpyrimidine synthase